MLQAIVRSYVYTGLDAKTHIGYQAFVEGRGIIADGSRAFAEGVALKYNARKAEQLERLHRLRSDQAGAFDAGDFEAADRLHELAERLDSVVYGQSNDEHGDSEIERDILPADFYK